MASDGVHVSIAGAPFGPPLPATGLQGPPGPPGVQGIQGIQGVPGVIQGSKLTLQCAAGTGTVPKGFTSICTVISIQ